jgi:hypothetical protein
MTTERDVLAETLHRVGIPATSHGPTESAIYHDYDSTLHHSSAQAILATLHASGYTIVPEATALALERGIEVVGAVVAAAKYEIGVGFVVRDATAFGHLDGWLDRAKRAALAVESEAKGDPMLDDTIYEGMTRAAYESEAK